MYFYPRSPCGERQNRPRPSTGIDDFYPRSPCGERRQASRARIGKQIISIHALLAESDNFRCSIKCAICNFYPRSPCGERHPASITPAASRNFYPRSPCGERQDTLTDDVSTGGFLSTLSLRRATPQGVHCYLDNIISIHALLAESDGSHGQKI